VALLTILFGVVLPWFVFKKLQNEMIKTKLAFEKNISHWIAQWAETYSKHGDKPFQDATFWIETVALTIEAVAPTLKHPAFQFLAEFAPILRRELDREREKKEKSGKVAPFRGSN
jgi:hypothetical protein